MSGKKGTAADRAMAEAAIVEKVVRLTDAGKIGPEDVARAVKISLPHARKICRGDHVPRGYRRVLIERFLQRL